MENNIDNTNVDTQQQQNEDKTFTQADIDRAVAEATKDMLSQDKVNEIVEKRLAREREKAEREKSQAEELARMSAEERKAKEFEIEMAKKNEEYETQMKEFNKMKAEFEQEKLLNQTAKELTQRGLPNGMANMLIGANAEETMKNIELYEKQYKADLEAEVNKRLGKSTTPNTNVNNGTQATKNPKDMSLSEFIKWREEQGE